MPSYQIKQSSTECPLVFLLVQSTDHISPLTGASPTVTISKAGASFASPSGAVTEIGSGWYKVAANAADSGTLGPLLLHATATSGDPSDALYEVVAHDVQDAVRLGLSSLPNAAAGANAGLPVLSSSATTLAYTISTLTTYTGNTVQTGDAYARLGAPAGASTAADIAAVKSDTGTILTDVNTGAGAIYTRLGAPAGASVSADIASVKTSVGAVTGAVGSVTGNVGGNVVGSTASVTGAVGSVTGNVGGNVTGSVGSVLGAVGSVTGNVGGNVTGTVGSVVGGVGGSIAGSVVGSVGSVSGNVGGNLGGNIGGNLDGNVLGSVGSLSGVTFPTGFSTLTTAAIATAILTDTTGSDFAIAGLAVLGPSW